MAFFKCVARYSAPPASIELIRPFGPDGGSRCPCRSLIASNCTATVSATGRGPAPSRIVAHADSPIASITRATFDETSARKECAARDLVLRRLTDPADDAYASFSDTGETRRVLKSKKHIGTFRIQRTGSSDRATARPTLRPCRCPSFTACCPRPGKSEMSHNRSKCLKRASADPSQPGRHSRRRDLDVEWDLRRDERRLDHRDANWSRACEPAASH